MLLPVLVVVIIAVAKSADLLTSIAEPVSPARSISDWSFSDFADSDTEDVLPAVSPIRDTAVGARTGATSFADCDPCDLAVDQYGSHLPRGGRVPTGELQATISDMMAMADLNEESLPTSSLLSESPPDHHLFREPSPNATDTFSPHRTARRSRSRGQHGVRPPTAHRRDLSISDWIATIGVDRPPQLRRAVSLSDSYAEAAADASDRDRFLDLDQRVAQLESDFRQYRDGLRQTLARIAADLSPSRTPSGRRPTVPGRISASPSRVSIANRVPGQTSTTAVRAAAVVSSPRSIGHLRTKTVMEQQKATTRRSATISRNDFMAAE